MSKITLTAAPRELLKYPLELGFPALAAAAALRFCEQFARESLA